VYLNHEGRLASEDIIRIRSIQENPPPGYIFAYLNVAASDDLGFVGKLHISCIVIPGTGYLYALSPTVIAALRTVYVDGVVRLPASYTFCPKDISPAIREGESTATRCP
jgi:hypothetical protein